MVMPTNLEMLTYQKDKLYDLLVLKQKNKSITVEGLDELITKAKSVMAVEDIAYITALVKA